MKQSIIWEYGSRTKDFQVHQHNAPELYNHDPTRPMALTGQMHQNMKRINRKLEYGSRGSLLGILNIII